MNVAFIKVKGHFNQIPSSFTKLYTWTTERGYKPSGPAMAVYYNIPGQVPDDELEWELRSLISEDIHEINENKEGLGVKHISATYVVSVLHKGPYENIEETYNLLNNWIEDNKYEVNGPPEELYFNSPEEVPPSELLTELRFSIN